MNETREEFDDGYSLPEDSNGGKYFPIMKPFQQTTGSDKINIRQKSLEEMKLEEIDINSLKEGDLVYMKGQDGYYYLWKFVEEDGGNHFEFTARQGDPYKLSQPYTVGQKLRIDPGMNYQCYRLTELPLEINAERLTPETAVAGMDVQTPDLNLRGRLLEIDKERERFKIRIDHASGGNREMWRGFDDLDQLMAA